MFFLKTLQRHVDCSFDNHDGISSLLAKKNFAQNLEKNYNSFFFSWNKFFLSLFLETLSAILSTMKIIIRCCHGDFTNTPKKLKCLKLASKTLLWKCSLGPINSKLDNHVGNFPLKLQVPLFEIKKCFEKAFALEKFYLTFFLCKLNLWLWQPWLTFLSEQKKTHKVLNKAQNVKFTFIIFFSKCCTGHLKCAFDNPEKSFSPENRCVRSMTEDFLSNSFASRKFSENGLLHR